MYLTAIMGRRDKKKTMNKANQEKDPQEVRNDKNDPQEVQNDEATEKYKFQDKMWEKMWHETLQKLPPGQIIDISYLKTLEKNQLVPIAFCPKGVIDPHIYCPQANIDKVTNFDPGYLARVTRRLWEVYDKENYVINKLNWDEGKNTLLDLFRTSIQHPEDHFVQYFGGTKSTLVEKGSPRRSPRKNPPETDNTNERGFSSLLFSRTWRSGSASSRRSQGGQ